MIITHETPVPPGVKVSIFKGGAQIGCVVEVNLDTQSCTQDFRDLPPHPMFIETDTWDTIVITKPAALQLPSPWGEMVETYAYVTEVSV